MNSNRYCVFVCNKQPTAEHPDGCCGRVGGSELFSAFQAEITARNLTERIEVGQSGCLNY